MVLLLKIRVPVLPAPPIACAATATAAISSVETAGGSGEPICRWTPTERQRVVFVLHDISTNWVGCVQLTRVNSTATGISLFSLRTGHC